MTTDKRQPRAGVCLIRCSAADAKKLKAAAKARRQSLNQYLISLALADYEKLLKKTPNGIASE